MKFIFFIFPNKYRASCMPWGRNLQKNSGSFVFRTRNRFLFKILTKIIPLKVFKCLPVLFYVSDPPVNFRSCHIRHLWWNDETELSWEANSLDYFACKLHKPGYNWLFIKPNLISLKSAEKPKFDSKIVYFGEPGSLLPFHLLSIDHQKASTRSLDKFLESNTVENPIENQELYRYLGILSLYRHFTDVNIYGTGWLDYFPNAHRSNYASSIRHAEYRGSICIDFGSKSGTSCLYNRSAEILLDFGVLLHHKKDDSCDIFGEEYCEYFAFTHLSDMIEKLQFLRSHVDAIGLHYKLLMNSPLALNTIKHNHKTSVVYEI